jgi:integrase
MRGMGRVFRRKNSGAWWIAYYHRGKEIRESSGSENKSDAQRLLRKRLGEIGRGKLIGPVEERVTFEDLASDYLKDYEIKQRRSLRWAKGRVANLRRHFGPDRAMDITAPRIRGYAHARLEEGATPATVNRDLAALGRMFSLAVQAGRLSGRPHIPKLREAGPRQGFMEYAEYRAIRAHLPPDYQDVLDFGYHSGWRKGEILRLEWRDADRDAGIIRLRPELSKNYEGRVLPLSEPLRAMIERRWRFRSIRCPLVFQKDERPIGDWRKTWKRACKAAGLPGKLFHDLRRTVVRNLIRAGVPERVAMSVTGHKTRSVFDRYNIVSEADLKQATSRLAEYVCQQPATRNVISLPNAAPGENTDKTRTVKAATGTRP